MTHPLTRDDLIMIEQALYQMVHRVQHRPLDPNGTMIDGGFRYMANANGLLDKVRDIIKALPLDYDPTFGDDVECTCGHLYYRHFDSYDKMAPVGCKYCHCTTFSKRS